MEGRARVYLGEKGGDVFFGEEFARDRLGDSIGQIGLATRQEALKLEAQNVDRLHGLEEKFHREPIRQVTVSSGEQDRQKDERKYLGDGHEEVVGS